MKHAKLPVAAHVFLINKNMVLLLKRINTGFLDNQWSVPAGRVNDGESISNAIIREANEEVGIKIKKQHLSTPLIMHFNNQNKQRIYAFFLCRRWQGTPLNCESKTCDQIEWFKLNKLPKKLMPPHIVAALVQILKSETYLELGF